MLELTNPTLRRRVLAAVLGIAMAAGAAACGSDDEGGGTAADGASTQVAGKSAAEWKAEKQELLDTANLEWPRPEGEYDPGSGRVAIVSCGESDLGCHTLTAGAQAAAKAAGWQSKVFDSAFDPNKAGGYVQQAVEEGYDAIVLGAINPTLIQSAVAAATDAGIPIGCPACATPDSPQYENVMDATSGGAPGGVAATAVIADSDAAAKVAYFYTPGQAIEVARTEQWQEKFDQCADCSFETLEVPLGDLAKPGPPFFDGFLSSPLAQDVDWVAASSDAYVVPSMRTAIDRGIDSYKFAGTAAVPEMTIPMTKPDSLAQVTVAEAYTYMAWAALDNAMRKKAGAPTWDATTVPVGLVTPENAQEYADGGELAPPEGIAETFEPLWTGG
ncbi:MAG: substrate-binding domain-containing protein [Solirubrobacterales bacterium]|nr:substrate-binding domain-containing protein [Solirubrobacterales bacterium]